MNEHEPGVDFGKDDWQPSSGKDKKESKPTPKWADMDTGEKFGFVVACIIVTLLSIGAIALAVKLVWVVITA